MIVSKTSFRISFFGGGTVISYFYKKNKFGHVVSALINNCIYVFTKKQNFLFRKKYRFNYSKTKISNLDFKFENNGSKIIFL